MRAQHIILTSTGAITAPCFNSTEHSSKAVGSNTLELSLATMQIYFENDQHNPT